MRRAYFCKSVKADGLLKDIDVWI